jgi:hypothetical protein
MERQRTVDLGIHELMHEGIGRSPNLIGRALGDHASGGQEIEVVHDLQRFMHIVRNHDRTCAQRIIEASYELADHAERNRVEAGERLVVHHQHRIERHCPRQRYAARHAAGKLRRHQVVRTAQSHGMQLHQHQIVDHVGADRYARARKRHVVEHVHVGKQGTELKQHAHAPPQCIHFAARQLREILTVHNELPGRRLKLPADQTQEGRLAATAAAHYGNKLATRNAQVDAGQDGPRVVCKIDVGQIDQNIFGRKGN